MFVESVRQNILFDNIVSHLFKKKVGGKSGVALLFSSKKMMPMIQKKSFLKVATIANTLDGVISHQRQSISSDSEKIVLYTVVS